MGNGAPQTRERLEQGITTQLEGVKLTYANGSTCPSSGQPYKFSINMYCDETMGHEDYEFSLGALGNICEPYIDTVSWVACKRLDVSALWDYISEYSEYFGVFLLISGMLLTFTGRKLLKPAICCAGFLTTIALSCLIFYSVYLEKESQLADFWYFLGGGAFVGIFIGLLLAYFWKIGAAVLAGWGGLCGGLILNETVLFRAEMEWLFWTSIVLCVLTAAVVSFVIADQVVIVATTLLGSYFLVRGVACYAGHYYNEITMAKMAKEGLLEDIDPWYWAYVGGFVVAVAVGMLIQCRSYKKELAKKKAKQHPYMKAAGKKQLV